MFFEYTLTIPRDTPRHTPAVMDAPLSAGTVALVAVQFPRGCRGEAQVSIWREEHQVWPVNLDGYLAADNAIIQWPEDYDLDDEPFAFILKGWSPTTRFPHSITFRFALLPLEAARDARDAGGLLRRLLRAFVGSA